MASDRISIGRSYSDEQLHQSRIVPTPYLLENVHYIATPVESLQIRGIPVETNENNDLHIAGSVFRFSEDVPFCAINLREDLRIYSNGKRIFFLDENNKVHFYYRKDASLIIDECVNSRFVNQMALRGLDEFHMLSGLSDKTVLDECYKMAIPTIVTHDSSFGKDNKLKKNKKIPRFEEARLIREYKKIKPFAQATVIFCERDDHPHFVFRLVNRKRKKIEKSPFDYFSSVEDYLHATF